LAGAVVAAVVICTVLALRHRRPKTIEADMESFSRGLRALAPESVRVTRRSNSPEPTVDLRTTRSEQGPSSRLPPPPKRSTGGYHDETEARSG
jgi:hypothetical protein